MEWGVQRHVGSVLEFAFLVVPDAGAPAVDGQWRLDLDVGAHEPLFSLGVLHGGDAADPGRTFAGHFAGRPHEAVLTGEVRKVDSLLDVEAARRRCARGSWNVVETKDVCWPVGVSPKPVQLVLVLREQDGVAAGDFAIKKWLFDGRFMAQ
jgi:hypothetical protein